MEYQIRVASLKYKVEQQGTVRFAEGMDIRRDVVLTGFTGPVEPNAAVFVPTREFSSVDQARAQLEPQLASWRAWIRPMELEDLLVFTFVGATRESSPPAPDGHYLLTPAAGHIGLSGQSPVLYHTRNSIPDPPVGFWYDDLVEVGIALYADAVSNPRHALKFAHAFLTLIEDRYGKQTVAKALSIGRAVLIEFRDLISRGGDGVSARKAAAQRRLEISAQRQIWLMLVFRELIRRHGQLEAGTRSLPQFTESCPGADADFPHRTKPIAITPSKRT